MTASPRPSAVTITDVVSVVTMDAMDAMETTAEAGGLQFSAVLGPTHVTAITVTALAENDLPIGEAVDDR